MLGRVDPHYGLYPGEAGKKKKKGTVVREYPFHILVDWGKYKTSVNKVDVYTGDVTLKQI